MLKYISTDTLLLSVLNLFSKSANSGCFLYIFIENSNTIYFPHSTTKASACKTTQTKTNTLMSLENLNMFRTNNLCCQFCIVFAVKLNLLFGFCLSALFVYMGYNFFSICTTRTHKHAKLLKDKQFDAYSSLVNGQQVEISLFCTQHYPTFDWLNLKMLKSVVSVLPCDWFSLSGWPWFL